MAKKLPPCDGTSETWGLWTLVLVGLLVAIELMVRQDADWLNESLIVLTLGLLARHHRRFHRPVPVEAPHQELIP